MSGTRRRPFRRTSWNPTADEAVALYAGLRDGPACGHSIFRADDPPCAVCGAWWERPHHWPAFLPTTDAGATHAQCALRDELEAALREARDARGVDGSPVPLSP